MDHNVAAAARAAGPDIVESPEPDTIEAVRASLANVRSTLRHRSIEQVEQALDDIDTRLWVICTSGQEHAFDGLPEQAEDYEPDPPDFDPF